MTQGEEEYPSQISMPNLSPWGQMAWLPFRRNEHIRRQYRYVVAKVPSSLQNRIHGLYIKRRFYLVRALAGLSRIASDNQASLQTLWAIATAILLETNLRSCKALNSFLTPMWWLIIKQYLLSENAGNFQLTTTNINNFKDFCWKISVEFWPLPIVKVGTHPKTQLGPKWNFLH